MKPILSLFVAILGVSLLVVIGLPLANALVAQPSTHQFAHLNDPPLWTDEPIRINRMAQAFPRADEILPDQDTAVASVNADHQVTPVKSISQDANPSVEVAASAPTDEGLTRAHIAWCAARYRSYQVEDNTYQPFGGARRICQSPDETPSTSVATAGEAQADDRLDAAIPAATTSPGALLSEHVAWCGARYSSYRAEDNTYQPYSGPRRTCQSPYAGDTAARDEIRNPDIHNQQAQM
ncbi:BA14K family protein [Rhizobium oryzicola]|uniref:Lectin-like protein BA14k n=1 Tax=Rhizobium oryzicola TaxID=1232668 RepID=A0ABT8T0W9_9HYPH|nr:BA14K family protein [Rhizobium oryzicola]MDO1584399.1 BA14K family protein [Rhizobium oryzicola]